MAEMARYRGKTVFVTGGASGLGAEMCRRFAAEGGRVAVADLARQAGLAADLVAEIRAAGGVAEAIDIDVREASSIAAAVAEAERRLGSLDVAVANAGVNVRKPALEVTEADWDGIVGVNLRGVFFTCQAVARAMVQSGRGGAILTIASIFGLVGGQIRAPYAAAKGGVVNLTRALAVEWAPHGIRVNGVAPTFVITPLTERYFSDPANREEVTTGTPNGRFATPVDIAEAAVFLGSDAAQMINGATLPVDGGWTAR